MGPPCINHTMMITPTSHARKEGKRKTEGGDGWESMRNQRGGGGECRLRQNGAFQSGTCVQWVEWRLGTRGLRIMAAFCAGTTVSTA